MGKPRQDFAAELADVGFSNRTINAVIYDLQLESMDELRQLEWGSVKERTGLVTALNRLPHIGMKSIAEVQAFRELGNASLAASLAPTEVRVFLQPGEIKALERWASERGLTRTEAVRALIKRAADSGSEPD
jgi:hypothetical protein